MRLSILTELVPTFLSLVALFVSIGGYFLSRKMENQNIVFQEKIKSYGLIITALNNLRNVVSINLSLGRILINEKSQENDERVHELAAELDVAMRHFNDVVVENYLLLPEKIVDCFGEFNTSLEEMDVEGILTDDTKYGTFMEKISGKFEYLILAMRKDLHAEKLNRGLSKRIDSSWSYKLFEKD